MLFATLQAQDKSTWSQKKTIPKWARRELKNHGIDRRYTVTYQIYPPYFRGDFNGDGKKDVAILVMSNESGKFGIAVIHERGWAQDMSTRSFILGAGKEFGTTDDFKWVTSWILIPEHKITAVFGKKVLPEFHGDIIQAEGKDGRKGLIYWSGRKYEWHKL